MPKKGKKSRNLTRAEKIAKIPIEQITTLKGDEGRKQLIYYIKSLRMGYNRRVQSFKRRGIFSYAQYSFEAAAPQGPKRELTKLTRNQLIGEFARYQSFFESQTSSLEGIKEINLAQDLRIFGEDEKGKPIKSMTEEARKKFWSLYDEYKNQYKTGIFRYSSETVQQFLASAIFEEDDFTHGPEYIRDDVETWNFEDEDTSIPDFLMKVEARLEQNKIEEDLGGRPNVYSGKGPYRSW